MKDRIDAVLIKVDCSKGPRRSPLIAVNSRATVPGEWIAARYVEHQAKNLQDQIPQASPCWNLIEISQKRKAIEATLEFKKAFSTKRNMAELELDPKKTALVFIDLQNAIVGTNRVPHTAAQVVENSKTLADAFRVHGAPVVYVRVDVNDFMKLPVDQPFNLGDKPLPAAASEIAPSADFQPGDILVTKRHWGAFAGTDLEQQLKSRGIDTVVLTGISTDAGVESTARQRTGFGFAFVLVQNACSSQSAENHRLAVEHIFPRITRVRSTDEVLASLA